MTAVLEKLNIAMDMTPSGLISQQSVAAEGQWMEVPHDWVKGAGA